MELAPLMLPHVWQPGRGLAVTCNLLCDESHYLISETVTETLEDQNFGISVVRLEVFIVYLTAHF